MDSMRINDAQESICSKVRTGVSKRSGEKIDTLNATAANGFDFIWEKVIWRKCSNMKSGENMMN
jgi:hypothetical protein